jgi:drug/metabolite transporter (DMT)-like permease
VDVTVSSLLMLASPVVSAVAALLILGEPIRPLTVAGGVVVLGSLAAILRRAAGAGEAAELESPDLPRI